MTDRSVKHSTFTLARTYPASPTQVFAAWSDRDTKAKWFASHDDAYTLDFRVGGAEVAHGRTSDGAEVVAESVYRDIVADERIVYTTLLFGGGVLSTVSVTTVEFVSDGSGPTWCSPSRTPSSTTRNSPSGANGAPATG